MSFLAATMAPSIRSIAAAAMRMILMNYTTKRLAALLRLVHAPTTRLTPARRPTVPPAAELVRIPAYMRRCRRTGRAPTAAAQRP